MTIELRDYFAGKVLQGLLANAHLQKGFLKDLDKIEKSIKFSDGKRAEYMQHEHASISYAFADAMMKERLNFKDQMEKEDGRLTTKYIE